MPALGDALPDLTVVIPAFNEATRLPRTLTEVLGYLAPSDRDFEILVVDDGSTDDTAGKVGLFSQIDPRVHLIRAESNRGKGHAVRLGVGEALGDLVLMCDADGSTPFVELARLEVAIAGGADVAIGSRAAKDPARHVRAIWYRKALGTVFNAIVSLLGVKGFTDTQCGFKLFRRLAARDLFAAQRLDGYAFDVEILALAQLKGYKVCEVALDWADQPGGKVNLAIDPLKMLRDIATIRWWLATGKYGSNVVRKLEAEAIVPTEAPAETPVRTDA